MKLYCYYVLEKDIKNEKIKRMHEDHANRSVEEYLRGTVYNITWAAIKFDLL